MGKKIELYLLGNFRMREQSGVTLQLKSQKACALIAMLAMAPNSTRSRSWLVDHLWSDRSSEQAFGSLRQTLSEIRRSLGTNSATLVSDRRQISLDNSQLWIDINDMDYLRGFLKKFPEPPVFLENIDPRDPEYEHWLTVQRSYFETKFEKLDEELTTDQVGGKTKDLKYSTAEPAIIRNHIKGDSNENLLFSDILTDVLCSSLTDASSIKVFDGIPEDDLNSRVKRRTVLIDTKAFGIEGSVNVGVRLTDKPSKEVLLSTIRTVGRNADLSLETQEVLHLINTAVDRTIKEFTSCMSSPTEEDTASGLCFQAVELMFSFQPDRLDEAEKLLVRAYEINRKGIYLSWLAYLLTFRLGESTDLDRQPLLERMRDLMKRAIDEDPNNALVLALCAYMQTSWLQNHEVAHELAEKSVALNPTSAIGIGYLGLTNTHLGNFEDGQRLTLLASQIVGVGPHKSQLEQVAFISTALAGDYVNAAKLGESVRSESSQFMANKRFLALMYAKLNNQKKLDQTLEELKSFDQSTSIQDIQERFSLSKTLRESALLNK